MSFESYMVDTITLADFTGVDEHATRTYGAQYTALCRFEDSDKIIIGRDGDEIQAEHVFATATEVKTTTRVWPPDADTTKVSESKQPIKIKHAREDDGTGGHYEVYL